MKQKNFVKVILCLLLSCVLIAAAWVMTGCETEEKNAAETTTAATAAATQGGTTAATTAASEETTDPVVGQGQTAFVFEVVHLSGDTKRFTVKTDKTVVGEALLDAGLITGEDSQYGLYVKTVDGETLDYDTHKKYWAFYVNGAYAAKGVDSTEIDPTAVYSFRAE